MCVNICEFINTYKYIQYIQIHSIHTNTFLGARGKSWSAAGLEGMEDESSVLKLDYCTCDGARKEKEGRKEGRDSSTRKGGGIVRPGIAVPLQVVT